MRLFVVFMVLVGVAGTASSQPAPPVSPEPPGFREFTQHVQDYIRLQKAVPRLRTTKQGKEIVERRRALAQKIRETRANAKQGDIFTPLVREEFQRAIRGTLRGPNAINVRKTIRQEEPVPGWKVSVNGEYPEHLPSTTVSPTLLLRLPRLPAEVTYGIIGHDFVLEDTEARVIVDFIPGVLP